MCVRVFVKRAGCVYTSLRAHDALHKSPSTDCARDLKSQTLMQLYAAMRSVIGFDPKKRRRKPNKIPIIALINRPCAGFTVKKKY